MRNLILVSVVTGAWITAVALDVHEQGKRPRARAYDDDTCAIPDEVASDAVRLLLCTGRLPVNCASADELELLAGVGSSRARAMVEHRQEHGPFEGQEDLEGVRGIGPVTAARLAGEISFERRGTSCASTSP